ncbi:Asp-tRNA(Asn)/Glu-tRNA(Gln) amidotransferase subunit GatA [bacterium]|nr:Asp-tRNA(Asn)/Glu-tRNA(Gln) amidotransferase subunit GatA [bacterium]
MRKLGAVALAASLESGQVSAVEAARECLAAIEADTHHCLLAVRAREALAEAEAVDRRRAAGESLPFGAGVPLIIKDNIVLRGAAPTTCASKILENFVSPYDAHVVERLREHGLVILGKANMDEFAMGSSNENSAFGPVGHPLDPERVPGGSSGGSAASVALRLAPLALGSDTGGSIRQPAAFCGLVGLKPTYGRVSRYGLVAYGSSLDQIGPLARSAGDAAFLLGIIAGHDRRDSTSADQPVPDYRAALDGDIRGLRLGLPDEYFTDALDSRIREQVMAGVKKLEAQGAEVRRISLPHTPYAVAAYYIIATAEASANLARFDGVRYGHRTAQSGNLLEMYRRSRSEGFGPEVQRRIMLGTYVLSAGYYDAYYIKAMKVRGLITRDFNRAFEQVDAVVTPTAPNLPWKIGAFKDDPVAAYLQDIYTVTVNLAGLPGVSVPSGTVDGMPVGLQLIGRPFEEATLLKAASMLEGGLS